MKIATYSKLSESEQRLLEFNLAQGLPILSEDLRPLLKKLDPWIAINGDLTFINGNSLQSYLKELANLYDTSSNSIKSSSPGSNLDAEGGGI